LNEELQSANNLEGEQRNSLAEAFISEKENILNLNSEEIEFHVEEEEGEDASPADNLRGSLLMDERRRQ
jgi:hypothetical protein